MGLARLGGLVRIVISMAIFTIVVEVIGTAIFYFHSLGGGFTDGGVWPSVFQSISAFNNAGFDIFGGFQSISGFQQDPTVVLVTAALIILGGISFIVIIDVLETRRLTRLSLDSKLVLTTTLALLIIGMVVILFTEYNDPGTLGGLALPHKFVNAFFQSVTARTAGFSTVAMRNLADYALFFTMLLMFIGGASGSTAGGIKVNTFGMVVATIWSTIKGKQHAGAFGREFTDQQIRRAISVMILSLGWIIIAVFVLTLAEVFDFLPLLFETVSAFGTVGLTQGITPLLSTAGRSIIILTMFAGRLGPLSLTLALVQRERPTEYRYPTEVIRIG